MACALTQGHPAAGSRLEVAGRPRQFGMLGSRTFAVLLELTGDVQQGVVSVMPIGMTRL